MGGFWQGFSSGMAQGQGALGSVFQGLATRDQRKQDLSDVRRGDQRDEFNTQISNLQTKYSSLLGAKGEETPASMKVKYALTQALQARDATLYNQPEQPGAGQKIGHKIGEVLHLTKPQPAQSLTYQSQGWGATPLPAAGQGAAPQGVPSAGAEEEAAPTAPAVPAVSAAPATSTASVGALREQAQANAPETAPETASSAPSKTANLVPVAAGLKKVFPARAGYHLVSNPAEHQRIYYQSDSDPTKLIPAVAKGVPGRAGAAPAASTQQQTSAPVPAAAPQNSHPEDAGYQNWLQENHLREDPTYDMYGAYQAGLTPSENGHMSDEYKLPNHPTYSGESVYAQKPGAPPAGEWIKGNNGLWSFKATDTNIKNAGGVDGLKRYFDRVESGTALTLPNGETYVGKSKNAPQPANAPAVAQTATSAGKTATPALANESWPAFPPGPKIKVQGPPLTTKQLRERAQKQQAEQEANQLLAAAPLSPEQQAVQTARANMAGALETLRETLDAVDKFFPPDQQQKAREAVLGKTFGTTEKPTLKPFRINGTVSYYDINHPELIPPGASAVVAGSQSKPITKIAKVTGKGWSYVSYDPTTGIPTNIMPGAPAPRSMVPTARTSSTTDPFGVTTTSRSLSQPVYRGEVDLEVGKPMSGNAATILAGMPEMETAAPEGGTAQPAATPKATPAPPRAKPGAAPRKMPAAAPKPLAALRKQAQTNAPQAGPPPLDAQNHIPESANVNPGLRSAANQLLDGMDLEKLPLPARDKQAAAALASKYGWGQGLFTPKEQLLIRESKTYLADAVKSPALKVLDSDLSRAKLINAIHASKDNAGLTSKMMAIKWKLNPQEAEFLRIFNQLSGTISGLGQLTRGGRVTEATINRLVNELPNPLQSQSSADARQRLKRLLSEIDVALNTKQGAGGNPAPAQGSGGFNWESAPEHRQ